MLCTKVICYLTILHSTTSLVLIRISEPEGNVNSASCGLFVYISTAGSETTGEQTSPGMDVDAVLWG